jgi:hypothetical protein
MLPTVLAFLTGLAFGVFASGALAQWNKKCQRPLNETEVVHEFIKARAKLEIPPLRRTEKGGTDREVGVMPSMEAIDRRVLDDSNSLDRYKILLDLQLRFVSVGDDFCALTGFERGELLGKPLEALSPAILLDVPKTLGMFFFFGRACGLWMFVNRQGKRILVRYRFELLSDMSIEMRFEPID